MKPAIRILHLEDDPCDARLVREQLLRSGLDASIAVAASREAFETALAAGEFDVVLSDYHLPQFDGLSALRLARSSAGQIPFILVTGALGDERAAELLRSGATDFVLKDRLARLAPAIERALSEQSAAAVHAAVEARLAQVQRLSKLAAEAARMGSWKLDVETGRLECSDDFLSLVGVQDVDWAGTIGALEALSHPDDRDQVRSLYVTHAGVDGFTEAQFRIRRPDGEMRWMYARGDYRGQRDAVSSRTVFGVMMDITERKRAEERLREADRRKDEFLATLAHELRNPLASIHNGLALVRRGQAQAGENDDVHAMLDRQLKHTIRLVDDLIDVSRLTLGKIELERMALELQAIVRNAVEMTRGSVEAAGHQLHVSVPEVPVRLEGDAVRLTQILANLLDNAAKYTPPGGEIRLSVAVHDRRAVLTVRDTGAGIPAPMLDRVFDLFTQVEGSSYNSSVRGLGIGLAMVRKLVELHGGTVRAHSPGLGLGSEFVVTLPLPENQPLRSGLRAAKAINASLSGRRVLVVDDNADYADSLALLLKLAGAEADIAYDGMSALEAMASFDPDVVLLDIGMPSMNGYAVASRVREDPRYRNVTLIAVTGFGDEKDRQLSLAAGFEHHITKPVDVDSLQSLLTSSAA